VDEGRAILARLEPEYECDLDVDGHNIRSLAVLSRQRSRVRVSSSPPFLSEHSWRSQGNSAAFGPRIISSARPWIDYRNRKILKMRCVSCCELCVRSKHDAGNHCVAQFAWTSLFMTHRHQIPSLLRRGCIKRSYTTLDLLKKDFLECLKQGRASLPNRQNLQSVTNFKDRDGSCPNRCARLFVEPFDNTPVRRVPHESRENVGI
jgi:hypothetical protein